MSGLGPFSNEPVLELRRASIRDALSAALAEARPDAADHRAGARGRRPPGDSGLHLDRPRPAGADRRDGIRGKRDGRGRRGRRGSRGRPRLGRPLGPGTRRRPGAGGLAHARAPPRPRVPGPEGVREALARSRRGRLRGDRLLRVLRARGPPAGSRGTALADRGRAQLDELPPARRRGGHLTLELPVCDRGRDDGGRAGGRQLRRPEAGRAVSRVRATPCRGLSRGGCPPGFPVAAAGTRRHRRHARGTPRRPCDCVHRVERGRPRDHPPRGRDARGPGSREKGRRRDGRKELRDRRCGR